MVVTVEVASLCVLDFEIVLIKIAFAFRLFRIHNALYTLYKNIYIICRTFH